MTDPFRAFVAKMARLTTPRDPEELAKHREMMGGGDITDDDVIDDLSTDFMEDEASALWRLIEEARDLMKNEALNV